MALTWPQVRDGITVFAAVVMTSVAVLFATTLPRLWQQAEDIGQLKSDTQFLLRNNEIAVDNFQTIESSLTALTAAVERSQATADSMYREMQAEFLGVNASLDTLTGRVRDAETDPIELLNKVGVDASGDVVAIFIEERLVLFPRTDAVTVKLAQAGYQREDITPFIAGYVEPTN